MVLTVSDVGLTPCVELLSPFGLDIALLETGAAIPGSYWGDSEAGLIGGTVYCRPDTPIHSLLHESCHYICMDAQRRATLDRDAGGDTDEENAVCYLQILLADRLPGMSAARMIADMDAWGYSFRLGSAGAWFERDCADTLAWLKQRNLIDSQAALTWRVRTG